MSHSTSAFITLVLIAGQMKTAENLRRMLEGSEIRESHRDCGRVQDAYSLRCMPQVHGAVRDTLAHCRRRHGDGNQLGCR